MERTKKERSNKPVNQELLAKAKKVMRQKIDELKKLPADNKIVKANQHLFTDSFSASAWPAAGELWVGGVGPVFEASANLYTVSNPVLHVDITASGWGAALGGFECEVAGAFAYNPSQMPRNCQVTIIADDEALGGCSLTVMSNSGAFLGQFIGPAEGLGGCYITHSGTMTVS
jgi:hypothetical protein